MKIPFFASFIVFCLWLMYEMKKVQKKENAHTDSFWERENAANNTRKQPMDDLVYITIPFDSLPMQVLKENEEVRECIRLLKDLSQQPIVNLTGLSNTDLKLRYGVANLPYLTDCDQNYTILARTLQKWASLLYKNGYTEEPKVILEFAVSTKTDVSATYAMLSEIYVKTGQSDRIEHLLQTAEELHSAMQPTIVRILQAADPYND